MLVYGTRPSQMILFMGLHLFCVFGPARHPEQHKAHSEQQCQHTDAHIGAAGQLIPVCIAAYTGIAVFAFFMTTQWQFWVLAVVVGMFQGGVQALSRSHFAKIIPPEKSGEYFGLFDICGKGASFLGTMIVSVGSQLTGSANVGVGSLIVLFIVGFVLFRVSCRQGETV